LAVWLKTQIACHYHHFLGGWLYDLGKTYHLPLLPWSVFAAVGLFTAWQLALYFRRHPQAVAQ